MTRRDSYLNAARHRAGQPRPFPTPVARTAAIALPAAAPAGTPIRPRRAPTRTRPYLPGGKRTASPTTRRPTPHPVADAPAQIDPNLPIAAQDMAVAPEPHTDVEPAIAAAIEPQAPLLPPLSDAHPDFEDGTTADWTLPRELARVRRRQRHPMSRLRRRWQERRHRKAWTIALIGLPLTFLTVFAIIVGPVIYQGTRAYQKVFVDDVPHDTGALFPVVNDEGTPELTSSEGGAEEAASLEWDGTEPLTMLLLGIDQRADEPTHTDTMILVWVDPVAKRAAMLPLPRDLKVIVPGYGVHKINAAYSLGESEQVPGGGPALTIQTIEANFGIRINHFAQVNFTGFVDIVNLLGGITIDVPYPIKDDAYPAPNLQYTRVYFPAGWQHMDGERALQYARTRHGDGDAQRSIRQQQVLLALRQQASVLDLIPQASEILTALGDSVRTDLELDQAIKLVRLATEIPVDAIDQYTLLNSVTVEDPDGIYYLEPDWDLVGNVLSQFTQSEVVPPAAALDDLDYDIPIRVENGTYNAGLAARVADLLIANGFTNVTFAPADNVGLHPETEIIDTSGNLTTAGTVAALIGFSPDLVDEQYAGPATHTPVPTQTPVPTEAPAVDGTPGASSTDASTDVPPTSTAEVAESPPAADAQSNGIVIILGDDAPDPAWYVDTTGGE